MVKSRTIKLEPLDTLFFRNSRPFNKGEDNWADGLFPPFPSVIYGALRGCYFSEFPDQINLAGTYEDPTSGLKINGIWLKNDKDVFLPVPRDCVAYKEKKRSIRRNQEIHLLSFTKPFGPSCNPTEFMLFSRDDKEVEDIGDAVVNYGDFLGYLTGSSSLNYLKLSDLVDDEPKIGIERGQTLAAEEHMLYRINMKRLINLEFIVEFENLAIDESGFMKLGGEHKPVSFEETEPLVFTQREEVISDNLFKLYMATPAIFEKGWIPGWVYESEGTYIAQCDDLKLKLLCAAIGKPFNVGGFDMIKKKQKNMYKAVPSGSVYYFQLLEGSMSRVLEHFHGRTISDINSEQGFGLCYVGGVTNV